MRFVGRGEYFRWLDSELEKVAEDRGRLVAIRGRRQVGKSRLLTEWLRRRGGRYLYYQALNKPVDQELESFARAVARSSLQVLPPLAAGGTVWPGWEAALEALAAEAAGSGPIVVVLDEFPYLVERDSSLEATLQAAWDHTLQRRAILLIVVGSDLSMMEAIAGYGRPLYQRIDVQRRVTPLSPPETADLLGQEPHEALDTYLVTGGFPKIVAARADHASDRAFLAAACSDEAHPLVFTGRQILDAEFPPHLAARSVLETIGCGESAWTRIRDRAAVDQSTLSKTLDQLRETGLVAAEEPLGARTFARRTRYRVADPYLRFWLRFLADQVPDIARGRGDLVRERIREGWQDYAGVAVEPLVREAIERLLPDERFGAARYVGSWWTRDGSVQVDLTGTARPERSPQVEFAGSIKWRARRKFGPSDVKDLDALAVQVPGWAPSSRRIGVSRTGFTATADLDVRLTPDDLLEAWER
ncbi:MAG: ATP-binding protein [Gemmatimonadota bacterium]|nr:ATP-binding protein [Gemmatimonadota bacterium]